MARSGRKYKDQTLERRERRERKTTGLHGSGRTVSRPKLYQEESRKRQGNRPRWHDDYEAA